MFGHAHADRVTSVPDPQRASSQPDGSWRIAQHRQHISVWIDYAETLWELVVPDEDAPVEHVRVHLVQVSTRRGTEASALIPLEHYRIARDWLRCLPDGSITPSEAVPALGIFFAAFTPFVRMLHLPLPPAATLDSPDVA